VCAVNSRETERERWQRTWQPVSTGDHGAAARHGRGEGGGEAHQSSGDGDELGDEEEEVVGSVDVEDGAPGLAVLGEDVAEGEEETTKPAVASARLGDVPADAKRRLERTLGRSTRREAARRRWRERHGE
jgi:hypothetical protein